MWQSNPSNELGESRIVAQAIKRRIDFQTYKLHIMLDVGFVEHLKSLVFIAQRCITPATDTPPAGETRK